MAYVDAHTASSKLGTGAAVLAIEAGLALALITGLATTIERKPETRFSSYTVPKPKEPPPPPAQPREARKDASVIERPPTLIALPPIPNTPITELAETGGSEGSSDLGDVTFPLPEPTISAPPELPKFKPRVATPRGKWQQWVTTNDYPSNDLRAEHQGRTGYRLSIDTSGAVTDCSITASSGFAGLDRATCENIKRRARFEPATDQTGARTSGSYSGSVSWQIPKE